MPLLVSPRAIRAPTTKIETREAIRAYSIAVAPRWSTRSDLQLEKGTNLVSSLNTHDFSGRTAGALETQQRAFRNTLIGGSHAPQAAFDIVKHTLKGSAEEAHSTDNHHRDQRSDQAVFNRRRTGLVGGKLLEKIHDSS